MYSTQKKLIFACDFDQEQFKTAFAKSLKEIRKYTGLSLRELSRMTDINSSLLSKYENEKVLPSIWLAYQITDFFFMTIEDFILYGLEDKPEDTDSIDIKERFEENLEYFLSQNNEAVQNTIQGIFPQLNIDEILKKRWA